MSRSAAIFIFGLALAAFFIYFIFNFWGFLRGPRLFIDFPQNGEFLDNSHILVKGLSQDVTKLELNGRPIYTDENGNFSESLILSPGLNIIELKADGRFGRQLSKRRTVMVKLPE